MLKLTGSTKSPTRTITFALPSDHPAGKVSVVGNFNDWTPGADLLKKRSNGTMSATVTLPSDYIVAFRYLGENGQWFDEQDADFVDTGASVILVANSYITYRETRLARQTVTDPQIGSQSRLSG